MFKKKLALIAGAVMLAASLAACGKKEEATTAAPAENQPAPQQGQ